MSKILIIGNSLAVTETIENIRKNDQESQISLFCTESLLPYERQLLPSLVAGQIKESQTHPFPDHFFVRHKVDVIANEKLMRISLKRKYITTQNKIQLDYDRLMVADLGALMPLSVKGSQKKGFYDCARLSSIKEMMKYLLYVDTAFVVVTNFQGFNMACALHGLGKEVTMICPNQGPLSDFLDDETGALLKQIVEGKGIRVFTNNSIDEILGDSDIKAVRLSSGKVIGAQMVIADFMPLDWRLLEQDSGYEKIEDNFFHVSVPLKPLHFGFKVLEGFCAGVTKLPEGGREYLKFDGPENTYKKIFAKENSLVGAVLFNASSHEKILLKTLTEGADITGQEEALIGG